MSIDSKISPAFEPFLQDADANDKRDAIVIYKSPAARTPPVRGRLRKLQQRLRAVKERAAAQQPVQAKLFDSYEKVVRKHQTSRTPRLRHAAIGQSELPLGFVEVTRKTLPELAALPNVVAVLPNQKVRLIRPKEISYRELEKQEAKHKMTWGLRQLEIPEMWRVTKGKEINVAVLDTGVYGDHPALNSQGRRVKEFVMIDPLGRQIKADPSFDGDQHGTHVCGTIAGGKDADGISIGVAPLANLLVAGVLVGEATTRTLLEGMSWAVQHGADIINMSFGWDYYDPHFAQVLDLLLDDFGVLPVVAIGNENHGNTSSPGNSASAFSVGAVEKMPRRKVEVAFFSSGASLLFPGETPGIVTKPDVVAPGVQIWSCIPPERRPDGTYQYAYLQGTSMATPHVAGVAALLMAAKPEAPVADIIEVLKETAKHPTGNRPDNRWGYGIIRPVEALKALQS
jgi:subtilisin family serine protease